MGDTAITVVKVPRAWHHGPMSSNRYVALLRGINVGGKNIVKMEALRAAFEAMGFGDVRTYIQSGNVVFSSDRLRIPKLATKVESGLGNSFGYESRVVVVSSAELETIVRQAPRGFGMKPAEYRYDVIFTRAPVTPADVMLEVDPKPGVDAMWSGTRGLYFQRLIRRAAQSRLPTLMQRRIYKDVTIRNWNTTKKLFEMAST